MLGLQLIHVYKRGLKCLFLYIKLRRGEMYLGPWVWSRLLGGGGGGGGRGGGGVVGGGGGKGGGGGGVNSLASVRHRMNWTHDKVCWGMDCSGNCWLSRHNAVI